MCVKYHNLTMLAPGCVGLHISIATVSYVIIAYCSCFDGYFGNLALFSKIYQEINSDIQVCSVLSSTYGQTLYNPRWQPTICSCYTLQIFYGALSDRHSNCVSLAGPQSPASIVISDQYQLTSETPFEWRFAGGPIVARFHLFTGWNVFTMCSTMPSTVQVKTTT